eukprot:tig00000057_g39.t1
MPPDTLEQNNRTIAFFGDEGFDRIRSAFVVVVGLGGVGSHSALMLARSGVERLRLVDFDTVTQSSLNRHACATRADLGRPKAEVMRDFIAAFAPEAEIEAFSGMFTPETVDAVLGGRPDYVVDNIDNKATKLLLLKSCVERGIPVVSSMGAGGQADPTRVRIGDIVDARGPLAMNIRKGLRKMGVEGGFKTVFCSEPPRARLIRAPRPGEGEGEGEEQGPETAPSGSEPAAAADPYKFRVGILPVVGFMPAIFGNACASVVLTDLGGVPLDPAPVERGRRDLYARSLERLEKAGLVAPGSSTPYTARRLPAADPAPGSSIPPPHADIDDVEYMVEQIWGGRSAVSGTTSRLSLCRWDARRPFGPRNCVLLSRPEAKRHEAAASPGDLYAPDFAAGVEARLARAEDRGFSLAFPNEAAYADP